MTFVPFTYDEPGEEAAPMWTPGTPRDKRVAIRWHPAIGCSAEQRIRGCALTAAPHIPWYDMNIAEIYVETRKAYEILNKIVPAGQNLFVRILPPVPQITKKQLERRRALSMFTNGEPLEMNLASQVATLMKDDQGTMIATSFDYDLIQSTRLAAFCFRSSHSLDQLCFAVSTGTLIVASDAGGAEEFLSRFAPPRSWHIAKTWDPKEWKEKILDLQGEPNDVCQTSVVDESPYITAWRETDEG